VCLFAVLPAEIFKISKLFYDINLTADLSNSFGYVTNDDEDVRIHENRRYSEDPDEDEDPDNVQDRNLIQNNNNVDDSGHNEDKGFRAFKRFFKTDIVPQISQQWLTNNQNNKLKKFQNSGYPFKVPSSSDYDGIDPPDSNQFQQPEMGFESDPSGTGSEEGEDEYDPVTNIVVRKPSRGQVMQMGMKDRPELRERIKSGWFSPGNNDDVEYDDTDNDVNDVDGDDDESDSTTTNENDGRDEQIEESPYLENHSHDNNNNPELKYYVNGTPSYVKEKQPEKIILIFNPEKGSEQKSSNQFVSTQPPIYLPTRLSSSPDLSKPFKPINTATKMDQEKNKSPTEDRNDKNNYFKAKTNPLVIPLQDETTKRIKPYQQVNSRGRPAYPYQKAKEQQQQQQKQQQQQQQQQPRIESYKPEMKDEKFDDETHQNLDSDPARLPILLPTPLPQLTPETRMEHFYNDQQDFSPGTNRFFGPTKPQQNRSLYAPKKSLKKVKKLRPEYNYRVMITFKPAIELEVVEPCQTILLSLKLAD